MRLSQEQTEEICFENGIKVKKDPAKPQDI